MLYAIGEITLVVIGVLIALQINNWNETRKAIAKEKIVLKEISQDLEANKKILTTSINIQNQRKYESFNAVLEKLPKGGHAAIANDVLLNHFELHNMISTIKSF